MEKEKQTQVYVVHEAKGYSYDGFVAFLGKGGLGLIDSGIRDIAQDILDFTKENYELYQGDVNIEDFVQNYKVKNYRQLTSKEKKDLGVELAWLERDNYQ